LRGKTGNSVITSGEKVALIDTSQIKLTPFQHDDLEAMQELKKSSTKETELKEAGYAKRMLTGSYADAYKYKSDGYVEAFMHYTVYAIWDVLLFMFAGMAFLKLGWLNGNASSKIYWWMALVGLPVGLTINYFRVELLQSVEFNYYEYVKQLPFDVYEIGRIFRSVGWFGLLMLIYKSGIFNWLFRLLQPVGQMAFTNYLSHSLIGALLFYGFGFGLFGRFERYEVYLIILSIMMFQIVFSHIWLRYYSMGPLEWIWRQLTYWKRLPIKK
jgi:uncharacterized protein